MIAKTGNPASSTTPTAADHNVRRRRHGEAAGVEAEEDNGVRKQLEHLMEQLKVQRGCKSDTDLTRRSQGLCGAFQGQGARGPAPSSRTPPRHSSGGIGAVFQSGTASARSPNARSRGSRTVWGTRSTCRRWSSEHGRRLRTGVAFTRDPGPARTASSASGSSTPRARTWSPASAPLRDQRARDDDQNRHLPTSSARCRSSTTSWFGIRAKLERHYRNMQDLSSRSRTAGLFMLQTRDGKRNGPAALRMAVEMCRERLIDRATAVGRVSPRS